MYIVVKTNDLETNHDDICCVPFTNRMSAYDFAEKLAETSDPKRWARACEDYDEIHERLDRFNDVYFHQVKIQKFWNTKTFALGDGSSVDDSVKDIICEIANVPFADIQEGEDD